MRYQKPPITVQEQIQKLQERGLEIGNDFYATNILSSISYYRLRAYTYPFQDNTTDLHPFIKKISFKEIIDLYTFDCKLRQLVFSALEQVEISFRTQIITHFAINHGSHWQTEPTLWRDTYRFAQQLQRLNDEVDKSDETFIKHYKEKYTQPVMPPCWMSLEVASFGLLSKVYQNLKRGDEKNAIAKFYKLRKVEDLENWMLCLSNLRNICAHHGRLWNRRLTAKPKLPYNTMDTFLDKGIINGLFPNKLYPIICCLYYLLNTANPSNKFKQKLIELMESCPLKQEKEMGFPKNWQRHPIWL